MAKAPRTDEEEAAPQTESGAATHYRLTLKRPVEVGTIRLEVNAKHTVKAHIFKQIPADAVLSSVPVTLK